MNRQTNHQKRFLTMALGGPSNYSGKAMRAAHKHLNLPEADLNAVSENLIATLNNLKVPAVLIDQNMTVVGSVKNDVLNLLAMCSRKINVEIWMMSFVRYLHEHDNNCE
jgi:hemoglobin